MLPIEHTDSTQTRSACCCKRSTPSPLAGEGWGEGDGCAQSQLNSLSTLPLTPDLTRAKSSLLSRKGRGDITRAPENE